MWRERLDVFWDGRRTLTLGAFDADSVGAPDLAVFGARDASFADAALLDFIDANRWRRGGSPLELPIGCAFVSLCAADGVELRLALVDDESFGGGGEWRLLLAEQTETTGRTQPHFRTAHLAARGDVERLTRDEVAASGAKLIWAISQRRQKLTIGVESGGQALPLVRLWPAQMVFPAQQSRLLIEALELNTQLRLAPFKAPFAIMEHWLSEAGAPMATLRMRFPSLDPTEPFLSRVAVVLVMHQRRRLRAFNLEEKKAGGAVIDPLTLADIRQATGWPQERPDVALSGAPIVVHNLRKLIAGGEARCDGVSIRRRANGDADAGVAIEVDFFGAALGDDIGLVSAGADAGDFGVIPEDPGGARYARLFRVERDGLFARRIEEDDGLLDEILRVAAESEDTAVGVASRPGEKTLSAQGRREKLLAELNNALAALNFPGRFAASKIWEILEPNFMAAFVALVEAATPPARAYLHRIGGYEAFRADPSLVGALVRLQEFPPGISEAALRELRLASPSLAYRFAAACGLSRVLAPGADAATQSAAWRLFSQGPADASAGSGLLSAPLVRRLAAARITLDNSENLEREAPHAARVLASEAMVERAAIYCEAANRREPGEALRDYLARRRDGEWTLLANAAVLASVVDEADAYWREVDQGAPRADAEEASERPAGLFATVRSFFARGGR
jgi:hypothetical protein